ncbi:aldo/keto reductase [Variovorax sp. E3]|uniref:aldo/keto reductase n=1 Tax=Variovorax sp. E3 TaxID=1914993 RepID=UPI0018DC7A0A|nr:aldo/keto reductase [Variovorax sp. E3]
MRTLSLPTGGKMPVLGLGTWRMGEDAARRAAEVAAVREAIVLGYRLIDTAEMYGEGGAETVVGQAVAEALRAGDVRRDELFVVSKVYPHNASRRGTREACERSLKRLGLDAIDLYLLHWRGNHPLRDTVAAMQSLVADGRIAHWGVSNFDTDDMQELEPLTGNGPGCAANQVYLSLGERGPEFDLLPWQRERAMPLMAYSPIDQGALAGDDALGELAGKLGVSAAQLALAAVIARPGVAAIPKAVRSAHLKENLAAAQLELDAATLQELDRLHPPPRRKTPLAMI